MDLFTHVLVAYLVSYGIVGFQPQYLAAGALAGGLPDGDVVFFLLARRFPMFRHHGITHSIPGVTIVAFVGGYVLAPRILPGSPLVYFAVMEAAGLAHMLQDAFTHFSVQPFLPFSTRPLELDADRAINLLTLIVSVVSFYVLLGVERNRVPIPVFQATIYLLMGFYAGYFALRLLARAQVQRVLHQMKQFRVPIPTGNPLRWLLLSEERANGRVRTSFAEYKVGRGITHGPHTVEAPLTSGLAPRPPITSLPEAVAASYPAAREASSMFDETYHFADAHPGAPGEWWVTWFSLEYAAFGRAAAVKVRIDPEGSITATRAWHTPLWRKELT